jgi:hypothetical protein
VDDELGLEVGDEWGAWLLVAGGVAGLPLMNGIVK